LDLTGDLLRGHSEMIVLSILAKKDSYGYEINKTVKIASNETFQFTEATLYTTFKRLEKKHSINAYWKVADSGRKRKYYQITLEGKKALETLQASWEKAKKNVDSIMYDKKD